MSEFFDFPDYERVNQIEDHLFLSGSQGVESGVALTSFNITHVLSVLNRSLDYKYESVVYLHLFADDDDHFDILIHIPVAIEFIEKAVNSGQNVLVHCEMGVSRSSTIVIAYIMTKYKMPYDSAKELVKSRRRVIDPNEGFIKQLKLYEELGFTLTNQSNVPKLRQLLVRNCMDQAFYGPYRNINYFDIYFKNRDIIESMTDNIKYGQCYLCANCGYRLFYDVHIIRDEGPDIEQSTCGWTYIEPQKWMADLREDPKYMSEIVINCPDCDQSLIEAFNNNRLFQCPECPIHSRLLNSHFFRISNLKFKIDNKNVLNED